MNFTKPVIQMTPRSRIYPFFHPSPSTTTNTFPFITPTNNHSLPLPNRTGAAVKIRQPPSQHYITVSAPNNGGVFTPTFWRLSSEISSPVPAKGPLTAGHTVPLKWRCKLQPGRRGNDNARNVATPRTRQEAGARRLSQNKEN